MNSGRRSCRDMRSFALIRSRMSLDIDRDGIAPPFFEQIRKDPETDLQSRSRNQNLIVSGLGGSRPVCARPAGEAVLVVIPPRQYKTFFIRRFPLCRFITRRRGFIFASNVICRDSPPVNHAVRHSVKSVRHFVMSLNDKKLRSVTLRGGCGLLTVRTHANQGGENMTFRAGTASGGRTHIRRVRERRQRRKDPYPASPARMPETILFW